MGVILATLNKLGYETEANASFIKLDRTGAIMSASFLKMQDGRDFINWGTLWSTMWSVV